jgi:mono/diheme cytochrome c family protein
MKRRLLTAIGFGGAATVAVAAILLSTLYGVGSSRLERTHEVETVPLTLPEDEEALARGAHLARIYGCAECHGDDLGGRVFMDAGPFRVTAGNLTAGRGGVGTAYSEEDFDRAIRHGVKPDGRSVLVMPSAAYHGMSDGDAAALIAYLRRLPPVDNELPPTEVRFAGRLLAAALVDPNAEVRREPPRAEPSPPRGRGPEYGAYLAGITCTHCHGPDLRGNPRPPAPGSPPAPDLAAAGRWTLAAFEDALRTGRRPGGGEMDPRFMPWSLTAAMTGDEIAALHAYLRTLVDRD